MNQKKPKIPRIPYWLLKHMHVFDYEEGYVGDIEEEYFWIQENQGRAIAKRWIWFHALSALPRGIREYLIWRGTMFRNYFKVAFRNLFRQKGYSFINIAGLAMGIACCILILLWAQDELSFDRFHEHADNLYAATFSNGSLVTPTALSGFLKAEYPEITHTSRYINIGDNLIRYGDTEINEPYGIMVDPDFFEMFTISFLKGGPESALNNPNTIMISEQLAHKYFGTVDPINKVMIISARFELTVAGVFKDYPTNSHFHCAYIIPLAIRNIQPTWGVNNIRTYVKLRPETTVEAVNKKISDAVERHRPQDQRPLHLQPITRLHLNPFNDTGGTLSYVYLFTAMALFILIIACINFINLTTAKASNRAKEVGIRKTVGAYKAHLIRQFFSESFLMTIIASIASLGLVTLFLPLFNNLTSKAFTWRVLGNQSIMIYILGVIVLTVLLAGSYPSLFLSRFQPALALKSKLRTGMTGVLLRKVLVILQFSLSILLILGTLMIFRQVDFLRAHDVGFDKNNIVYFGINNRFSQNIDTIKTELRSNPNILNVTLTDIAPYRWNSNAGVGDVHWEGKTDQRAKMVMLSVDHDYLDTFGLAMAEGRFFSREYSTDPSDAFVVNQAAVRAMEMDNPIGKELQVWDLKKRIIGVVQDYHFESLHNQIIPMAMRIDPSGHFQACVRITSQNIPETLAFLETQWKIIYPEFPFEYRFLDDTIQNQYRTEQSIGRIVTVFTVLALFISCLGIFGLSAYTAEQRTKEIGIRKVLGASVSNIITHISKEFIILVIIANIIAWPLAYYFLNQWLQSFPFRTNIGLWIFALTGLTVLTISLLTTSWQIIRAAVANPVDSLRYE